VKKIYLFTICFIQFLTFSYFYSVSLSAKLLFLGLSVFTVSFVNPPFVFKSNPAIKIVLILFPFFCISTYLSHYMPSSLIILFCFFVFLFVFLTSSSFLDDKSDYVTRSFYQFLLIIFTISAAFGLYQFFSFVFLGTSPESLIPFLLPPNKSIRVVGPYGQPNLFSLLLLVGILVHIYLHVHEKELFLCRLKCLRFVPLSLVATVFFLTGSRAGLLAFCLIFLFLIFVVIRPNLLLKSEFEKREFIYTIGVLLASFALSLSLNYTFSDYGVSRGLADVGISTDARFIFWTSAILIFLDHPWFGVGLDNFKFYLPKYINHAHDLLGFVQYEAMGYTKWAHNELLQLLCEGGIFVFLIVLFLLGLFFYQLYLYTTGRKQWTPLKLYSHLFLLPFIIQSMFSWPMRHPALLVLFFTFLGILLSQYPYKVVIIPVSGRLIIRCIALCGLVVTLLLGLQEIRMGSLVHDINKENIRTSFSEFEQLVTHPYSEYSLLSKVTPRYAYAALQDKDIEFAGQVLPYIQELVNLQGAHWQWYNLSLICHFLERDDEAKQAIAQAINLWPTDDKYWLFQHYLNMLTAARNTGRPLEDFLPIPPGGAPMDIEEIFGFDNRIKVNI